MNCMLGWSRKERILFRLIAFCYPPLLPLYLQNLRTDHCIQLINVITQKLSEVNFWRNEEEKMRNFI